jgi:hypothetical protein
MMYSRIGLIAATIITKLSILVLEGLLCLLRSQGWRGCWRTAMPPTNIPVPGLLRRYGLLMIIPEPMAVGG